jgi:hypothetical protein
MKTIKKLSILMLLSLFILLTSCSKEDAAVIDSSADSQLLIVQANRTNGNQRINPNQTNARLVRGVEVSIPLFSQETVEVSTGSWITITFSIQDVVNLGPCQGPLSEAQITSIMEDAAIFITETGLEIDFDGNQIDILTHLRADEINTVINNLGDCQYILPFRYYVRPQSVGAHTLSMVLNGTNYSREVIWVPGS